MTEISIFDPTEFGLTGDDLAQETIVQSVVAAAGGQVAGRVRLQKLVFLLDKLGLNSSFDYAYHHYGPYSSGLSDAIDMASAFGMIKEEFKNRASDGARYSVFSARSKLSSNPRGRFFARKGVQSAINIMNAANATVLELAATAYWLKHDEGCSDWRDEIVRRKGQKTDGGRLQKALDLLSNIKLAQ
jgi:uncharacterized protein YwgA